MNLKKTLLAMAVSSLCVGAAQAGITVDNWDLDTTLATIEGGSLNTVVNNFDEMVFTGIARSVTDITGGTDPNALDVGDLAAITVYGNIVSFEDAVTGTISVPELNSTNTITINGVDYPGWELTFVFVGTTEVTALSGDDLDFEHVYGGTLSFYIDNLTDASGAKAVNGNASSYSDGTLVLTVTDDGTGGGSTDFRPNVLDGSDDASFIVTLANSLANLAGVFTRDGTYDLGRTVGSDASVDSNFDLDPDNNNEIDSTFGAFTSPECDVTRASFCAKEDGSATFSVVPEPGTLALLGMGLLGFGVASRRRK